MKLGMIDYGRGNLRSVINACHALGHDPKLVSSPDELKGLTHLIFPGQGAFGECMTSLRELDLETPLKDWIHTGKPYFGICVGYQLLFESSEESPNISGLGVVKGHVKKFTTSTLKIPHMGWNAAVPNDPNHRYWHGLTENHHFYFVHSYFPEPEDHSLSATTTSYGRTFTSAIQRENLLATQFHPEKSQHAGLTLIGNFLK